jgi:hypothetical protein
MPTLEPSPSARRALATGAVLIALVLVFVLGQRVSFAPSLPPASSSHVEVKPTPNVLVAMRALSRLETESFHLERVIELTDEQTKLYGLLRARDAVLLVAVGDVVAGVDLQKLADADVTTDWNARSVRVKLPAPEVLSSSLDNAKTHVFSRSTDLLASRKEELEGLARAEAEASMRKAAVDEALLDRARASAERAITALLRSLGFETIAIDWTGK